jgi:hypothetical protein
MRTPTPATDAAPPERGCEGIIFLAGAIKYWWLVKCDLCGFINPEGATECTRPLGDGHRRWTCDFPCRELWGGDEHTAYVAYRDRVRALLVKAGYLTYAPHEAFKGTWDDRAQAVNDAGIAAADLMLNLSPEGAITVGTDDEVAYAERIGTPVVHIPPTTLDVAILTVVQESIRRPYDGPA